MKREKYDELILKLTLATMSRKITWEQTCSKDGFQVNIGKNRVSILCCDSMKVMSLVENKGWEIQSAELNIINSKGESIECYRRKMGEEGFEQLKELFVTVRRNINNVDEILDELLKELEQVK